jgi:hypothetical protein
MMAGVNSMDFHRQGLLAERLLGKLPHMQQLTEQPILNN